MRMVKIQMLLLYSDCLSFTYSIDDKLTIIVVKASNKRQQDALWVYDLGMRKDVQIDPLKIYLGNAMVVKDGDSTEVIR